MAYRMHTADPIPAMLMPGNQEDLYGKKYQSAYDECNDNQCFHGYVNIKDS